jgi:hypothetical protein
MSRKSIYSAFLVFMLYFATTAPADELRWDNSNDDSLWRTPENWNLDKLPGQNDTLYVDWLNDPTEIIIDADTDAKCNSITLSNDSVYRQDFVHLHMTGGTFTIGNFIRIGREETGMFTLDAGEVTCYAFQLGRKDPSKGVAYINGGTITVETNTRVPRGGSQGSELHLNGGILYTGSIVMNDPDDELSGTNGWTDITEGVMILTDEGDQTKKIKEYVTNGWITAYGVKSGELLEDGRLAMVQMDYDVTNPGKTTVWATVSNPTQARAPQPQDGVTVQLVDSKAIIWTPGDKAVRHDVYFGTDQNAVTDADTSDATNIYRGRINESGYILPETLEWGQTYYWRIDEIEADDTVHTGPVWSFTVADYLLVDDFEGYDTGDNQIWYSWKDGFGYGTPDEPNSYYAGNGTGAAVGDETTASYTEELIVHGTGHSMPYYYDNNKNGYAKYSEAEKTLSYPRDWTEQDVAELSLWFIGFPPYVGGFTEEPAGTYTMTASGTDIWDASDQFHFAYKEVSGDATIQVQVLSVSHTDDWAKAGVMIRDSLDPNSAHAMMAITPANGVWYGSRMAAGQSSTSIKDPNVSAPQWVKLERSSGGLVRAYYSADGSTWTQLALDAVIMKMPVYIGLALTSHNPDATCEASFTNVSFPDTNVDTEWTDQDVGILSNIPEPIYVSVSNSTGTPAVVYHDDPNATVIDTWTEWIIPLQTFANQGIDLTDVDKIAIGIGTKGNMTTPGGSGKMFFDDIRLYRQRSKQKPEPVPEP